MDRRPASGAPILSRSARAQVISPATLPNVFLKIGEGHAGIPQMIVLVPKSAEIAARPSG